MLLLQAQSPAYMQIILFGGIFVVFYFFMIRPQQKKTEDQKKMVEELKEGDEILATDIEYGACDVNFKRSQRHKKCRCTRLYQFNFFVRAAFKKSCKMGRSSNVPCAVW